MPVLGRVLLGFTLGCYKIGRRERTTEDAGLGPGSTGLCISISISFLVRHASVHPNRRSRTRTTFFSISTRSSRSRRLYSHLSRFMKIRHGPEDEREQTTFTAATRDGGAGALESMSKPPARPRRLRTSYSAPFDASPPAETIRTLWTSIRILLTSDSSSNWVRDLINGEEGILRMRGIESGLTVDDGIMFDRPSTILAGDREEGELRYRQSTPPPRQLAVLPDNHHPPARRCLHQSSWGGQRSRISTCA